MTEGNVSMTVTLSKQQVAIARGMGMTLPQLASRYGLSNQQMRMALIEMKFMKAETAEKPEELTEREKKFLEVCENYHITYDDLTNALSDLGMEYKTGKRATKGTKKYTIIDDLTATA